MHINRRRRLIHRSIYEDYVRKFIEQAASLLSGATHVIQAVLWASHKE
jgi:hypothetical protein